MWFHTNMTNYLWQFTWAMFTLQWKWQKFTVLVGHTLVHTYVLVPSLQLLLPLCNSPSLCTYVYMYIYVRIFYYFLLPFSFLPSPSPTLHHLPPPSPLPHAEVSFQDQCISNPSLCVLQLHWTKLVHLRSQNSSQPGKTSCYLPHTPPYQFCSDTRATRLHSELLHNFLHDIVAMVTIWWSLLLPW